MVQDKTKKYHISVDFAKRCLPEGDEVHVMSPTGFGAIGSDWSKEQVLAMIEDADDIQVSGAIATGMGHEIAVLKKNDIHFIESKIDWEAATKDDIKEIK